MMKLHIYLLRSGLYAAAAMMAAACSGGSSDEPAVHPGIDQAGKAMSFAISDANLPMGASAASRAQITGDGLTEFTVWASMRSIADNTNPGACTPVFSTGEPASPTDFVTVGKDADAWNYADGNQNMAYWQNQSFYSFAAFAAAYPAGTPEADKVTPVFAANGHTDMEGHNHHLTIAGFDGTRSADLIYATETRMVENLNADTGPVSLTFHHITSRLQIMGRVDPLLVTDGRPNPTVTVTSITLSGMDTRGAWDGSAFDPTASTDYSWTSSAPGTYATNSTEFSVGTGEPTDLFNPAANPDGTDILMIPQDIPAESVVTITYRHNEGDDTAPHTVTLNLYEATVAIGAAHWLPGRSYRYTVNFGAADYILFDAPTVEQWDYQTGGNIIVQPTN